jgi:tetratricopeptide (TPR) repeat protein
MALRVKSIDDMLRDVTLTLRSGKRSQPAYTLLVGSGFSFPVIPTPTQMLKGDIAWWRFWKERGISETFLTRSDAIAAGLASERELVDFERKMWDAIHNAAASSAAYAQYMDAGGAFTLGTDGLPDLRDPSSVGNVYLAIMRDGLTTERMRRLYFRDVIQRSHPKVNGAHIFLAGILARQETWEWPAPFCRTIFTTNFDTLLQRSLQLVNKLYYMTDRPSLLEPPDDSATDAVHLVYTHGSVHRYELLNTDERIGVARQRNAASLIDYFERHGVIVMGYSGWHDTTMETLLACSSFDSNLYWCDLHPYDDASRRLRPEVVALLEAKGTNAFYVPITDAGEAMRQMHRVLNGHDVPDFIVAPVSTMIAQLRSIEIPSDVSISTNTATGPVVGSLATLLDDTLTRLVVANLAFNTPSIVQVQSDFEKSQVTKARIAKLMSDAVVNQMDGNLLAAIASWNSIIAASAASTEDRCLALYNRAVAYTQSGRASDAISDYTAILATSGATAPLKAMSLFNRGVLFGDSKRLFDAINDYSAVLAIPEAEMSLQTNALINRGNAYDAIGIRDTALSDYTAVATNLSIPEEMRALAILNRAMANRKAGMSHQAIDDCTVVILMGASPTLKVRAFDERGLLRREAGQLDEAVADYSAALALNGVPPEETVNALLNRSAAYGHRGDWLLAMQDCNAIVTMPQATSSDRLGALLNRGVAHALLGHAREAINDYTAVLDASDSDVKSRATALVNRAMQHEKNGDLEAALADCARLMTLINAPVNEIVKALTLRARAYRKIGRVDQAIEDYSTIINMETWSIALKTEAYLNRGEMLLEHRSDVRGFAGDSEAALVLCPSDEQAMMNLGIACLLRGEPEKAEMQFDQVIATLTEPRELQMARDLIARLRLRPTLQGVLEIIKSIGPETGSTNWDSSSPPQ